MSQSPSSQRTPSDAQYELQQRAVSSRPGPPTTAEAAALHEARVAEPPVPANLQRAHMRLSNPILYPLVGFYRLLTDPKLSAPAWAKCKHGAVRGFFVGVLWVALTYDIQRWGVGYFLKNSPRIAGLADDTVFGWEVPFGIHTYATLLQVTSQMTWIIKFFLSKNIRIAKDRAWSYVLESRAKGADFFGPYVEEWDNPPVIDMKEATGFVGKMKRMIGLRLFKQILLWPTSLYPFAGPLISAWFKALDTGRYLHRQYFKEKKMTPYEVEVFMEERKWEYRAFGFVSALLESLPIIGLVFSVSNRIGGAMWAFDLEKRQHWVAQQKAEASGKAQKLDS